MITVERLQWATLFIGNPCYTIRLIPLIKDEVVLPEIGAEYCTIKAKTHREAIASSPFFIGQKAEVESIQAIANADGTWMVTAKYKLTEEKPK